MSRNLGADTCKCGYKFGIPDFVGQPIEFRQYGQYVPQMGTKLICPKCTIVYFGWISGGHIFWGHKSKKFFDQPTLPSHSWEKDEERKNPHQGLFAKRYPDGIVEELGYYQIDLSYYESYNDEGEGVETDEPLYLLTDDCKLTRWNH